MRKLAIVCLIALMMLSIPMVVASEESATSTEPVYKRVGICRTLSSGRTWCYFGRVLVTPATITNIQGI